MLRTATRLASLARTAVKGVSATPLRSPAVISTVMECQTVRLATTSFNGVRGLTMSAFRASQGVTDQDLAHCLEKELSFEQENKSSELPEFLTKFNETGLFMIRDVPGHNEVQLTRTFGTETITVTFSASEILNAEDTIMENNEEPNPKDLGDEEEVAQMEDEEVDYPPKSYPVRFNVLIEKPGQPTLSFDLTAEYGDYGVDHISVYEDNKMAKSQTAEADYQRRGYYMGPTFGYLDEDLKASFEKYLEERGIDGELALFIPDYIEHKEQTEYTRWLNQVHNFVRA
ncbi:Mitochondrial acidic protein mam33 [Dispira simplex]|nr:Mitochondrial acidic protein mam33 [Dispira simplex]